MGQTEYERPIFAMKCDKCARHLNSHDGNGVIFKSTSIATVQKFAEKRGWALGDWFLISPKDYCPNCKELTKRRSEMSTELKNGLCLLTKNGAHTGNAVIVDIDEERALYRLVTDFGNKMNMNIEEIENQFDILESIERDYAAQETTEERFKKQIQLLTEALEDINQ